MKYLSYKYFQIILLSAIFINLTNSNSVYSQNIWAPYLKSDNRTAEIFFGINEKIFLGETNRFGLYDEMNDTIVSRASLSTSIDLVSYSFAINNIGYVISNNKLFGYYPESNKWILLLDNVPVKSGGSVQISNNKAYFFSSITFATWSSCESYSKEVWEFDPNSGVFSRKKDLPFAISGFSTQTNSCQNSYILSTCYSNRIFILTNPTNDGNSNFIEYLPNEDSYIFKKEVGVSSSATLFNIKDKNLCIFLLWFKKYI